jgi:hypothetical protein
MFSNCCSVVYEKSSSIRESLSYRVNHNHSNVKKKKTTFLISGIYLTYKFVIQDIKRIKIIFLYFFIYWLNFHDFNKPIIKAKNAC